MFSRSCNCISTSLALNSPSLIFNISGNLSRNPCSTKSRCLGLILPSKLNEKNCGKLFNSSKSPFISFKKVQSELHAGDEQHSGLRGDFPDVGEGDADVIQEKIEDRVEVGVRVGGEELREHVEDAAEGGALDAHGMEAIFDGFEGGERRGSYVGVLVEGFSGIHSQFLEDLMRRSEYPRRLDEAELVSTPDEDLARVIHYSSTELAAGEGLTKRPVRRSCVVGDDVATVAGGDFEREGLAVEIQAAFPILPPVSRHGLPPSS
nr:Agamous-like MADS-box protein AGL30 [Ipomoea batatas]